MTSVKATVDSSYASSDTITPTFSKHSIRGKNQFQSLLPYQDKDTEWPLLLTNVLIHWKWRSAVRNSDIHCRKITVCCVGGKIITEGSSHVSWVLLSFNRVIFHWIHVCYRVEHNTIAEPFGTMTTGISHKDWETSDFAGRGTIYISSESQLSSSGLKTEFISWRGGWQKCVLNSKKVLHEDQDLPSRRKSEYRKLSICLACWEMGTFSYFWKKLLKKLQEWSSMSTHWVMN